MKYKAKAIPQPYSGTVIVGEKLTVPDQSMSLEEIIARFLRQEALPIKKDATYHESEDDLGKVAHADLTEQEEFVEKQKETARRYERQEKKREAERLEKVRQEERARIAEEERQKAVKEAAPSK